MSAQEVLLPTSQSQNATGLVISGVLFVTVLVLTLVRKNPPPFELLMRRVFLALFAGLVANYIAGTVDANLPGGVRATGALAVTVIVYLVTPGGGGAVAAALLIILAGARPAAADPAEPDWIIAFNLLEKGERADFVSQVYSFDPRSAAGKDYRSKFQSGDFAAFERDYGSDVHRTRWIGRRGQSYRVYVIRQKAQTYDLAIEELPRDTQFAGDLARLIRTVDKKTTISSDMAVDSTEQDLTRTRANLKVTVKPVPTGTQRTLLGDNRQEPKPLVAEVVTGPREHLYLSTGVPFNSIDQFTVDENNQVVPKEVPKKFLIGVHWQVGDILTSDQADVVGGMNLGVQLQADSKPLEHVVLSVGYRMQDGVLPGTGLQYFTPFFGLQRAQQDRDNGSGVIQQHTVWQSVWGISLNLDKALGWLKPS